jgi:hypothetical protein
MEQAGFRLDWERGCDRVTVSGDAYAAQLGESVRVHTFVPPVSFLVDEPVDRSGPAFLPHVFERFQHADASTTRSHRGLGLGWPIVKELTPLPSAGDRASSLRAEPTDA